MSLSPHDYCLAIIGSALKNLVSKLSPGCDKDWESLVPLKDPLPHRPAEDPPSNGSDQILPGRSSKPDSIKFWAMFGKSAQDFIFKQKTTNQWELSVKEALFDPLLDVQISSELERTFKQYQEKNERNERLERSDHSQSRSGKFHFKIEPIELLTNGHKRLDISFVFDSNPNSPLQFILKSVPNRFGWRNFVPIIDLNINMLIISFFKKEPLFFVGSQRVKRKDIDKIALKNVENKRTELDLSPDILRLAVGLFRMKKSLGIKISAILRDNLEKTVKPLFQALWESVQESEEQTRLKRALSQEYLANARDSKHLSYLFRKLVSYKLFYFPNQFTFYKKVALAEFERDLVKNLLIKPPAFSSGVSYQKEELRLFILAVIILGVNLMYREAFGALEILLQQFLGPTKGSKMALDCLQGSNQLSFILNYLLPFDLENLFKWRTMLTVKTDPEFEDSMNNTMHLSLSLIEDESLSMSFYEEEDSLLELENVNTQLTSTQAQDISFR